MSKRSIIVLLKTFLPASEAFILDQIMAMHQKYDVFVVCSALSNENEFPEDRVMLLSSPGKTALILRKLYEKGFTNILFQTRTDKDLMQIIAEVNPACIVVHFGTNLMFYPCLQDISIPVSVWFHGYDASAAFSRYSGYRKIMLSMLSQKHIHPIFVSKGIKAIFESHIGWEVPGDIHYLGVPMDFGKASLKDKKIKTSTNPYQFLQVGRLVEKKGHLYTLEALDIFRRKHPDIKWKYTIIGSGPLEHKIVEEIIRLELQDHIMMLPEMPRNQIIPFFIQADLFLQHSITGHDGDSEGLPVVLMEAMLLELTVISTMHSGITELIEDKKEGYLCHPGDIPDFAECISNGLLHPTGDVAKLKIETSFDSIIHQNRYFEWLESRSNLSKSI